MTLFDNERRGEKMPKSLIDSAEEFGNIFEQRARQMLNTAKSNCTTYGEVSKTLKNTKRDLLWSKCPNSIVLVDRAIEMLEEEKNHLPVVSSD